MPIKTLQDRVGRAESLLVTVTSGVLCAHLSNIFIWPAHEASKQASETGMAGAMGTALLLFLWGKWKARARR